MHLISLFVASLAVTTSTLADHDANEFYPSKEDASQHPIHRLSLPYPHGSTRLQRFPTVDERVRLYMSNWYLPPCSVVASTKQRRLGQALDQLVVKYGYEAANETVVVYEPDFLSNATTLSIQNRVEPDTTFFLDHQTITDCAQDIPNDHVVFPENMRMYCADVADTFYTAYTHQIGDSDNMLPILFQFGDLKHSHIYRDLRIPHFKKFRSAATTYSALETVTTVQSTQESCLSHYRPPLHTVHSSIKYQPIIWKLASSRHFRLANQVHREDTPWRAKLDVAVFRGQLTGSPEGYDKDQSDFDNCMNMRRCRLVYQHYNSTSIYAQLTSTRGRIADELNGVPLVGPKIALRKLLEYKAIIMLEGNDVASGLKWALLSQSVVLMPRPRNSSWLMEELLVPWIHYIPLSDDLNDVQEQMDWILQHDKEAQQIAMRGSLWMQDLVFHPDAMEEDRLIQEEMIRRYTAHFEPTINANV